MSIDASSGLITWTPTAAQVGGNRVVLKVLEILGQKFGSEINNKGYRVLHPKVRVIQGDGVNYWTIQDTLAAINRAGWSADSLTFGMGGALLQQLNRDTQKFAFKCSSITVHGKDHDVFLLAQLRQLCAHRTSTLPIRVLRGGRPSASTALMSGSAAGGTKTWSSAPGYWPG